MRCLTELENVPGMKIGFIEFHDFVTPFTVLRNFDQKQIEDWKQYFIEEEYTSHQSISFYKISVEKTAKKEFKGGNFWDAQLTKKKRDKRLREGEGDYIEKKEPEKFMMVDYEVDLPDEESESMKNQYFNVPDNMVNPIREEIKITNFDFNLTKRENNQNQSPFSPRRIKKKKNPFRVGNFTNRSHREKSPGTENRQVIAARNTPFQKSPVSKRVERSPQSSNILQATPFHKSPESYIQRSPQSSNILQAQPFQKSPESYIQRSPYNVTQRSQLQRSPENILQRSPPSYNVTQRSQFQRSPGNILQRSPFKKSPRKFNQMPQFQRSPPSYRVVHNSPPDLLQSPSYQNSSPEIRKMKFSAPVQNFKKSPLKSISQPQKAMKYSFQPIRENAENQKPKEKKNLNLKKKRNKQNPFMIKHFYNRESQIKEEEKKLVDFNDASTCEAPWLLYYSSKGEQWKYGPEVDSRYFKYYMSMREAAEQLFDSQPRGVPYTDR